MTDRLSRTNALADANIERQKAERIATEIFVAIHDNVATNHKGDVATVKTDLQQLEQRKLLSIAELEHRLVTRLGGLVVVVTGLLFVALHYWPPNG
jgi:hypothetical protein